MTIPQAPKTRNDFKIAIICALSLEAENVQSMFDRRYDDEGKRYGKVLGDPNAYTTGVLGEANVVLVHMSNMGSTSAASSATGLRSSYPGVQLVLLVGVCGVVPTHPQTHEEIALGDIVVSTAVVQYDFGRQHPGGFRRKQGSEGDLGARTPELRAFINKLQTLQCRQQLAKNLTDLVGSEDFQNTHPNARYPGINQDLLFESTYIHKHQSNKRCEGCYDGLEVCSRSCDELGCEQDKTITRNLHRATETEKNTSPSRSTARVHFGRFGSANTVMRSGVDRDRIAQLDELIAFEMEGAGIWELHPTIIIKSACDYADSHKNKKWQAFAAIMAAAFTKLLLAEWTLISPLEFVQGPIWHVPLDHIPGFIGRADELERVKRLVSGTDNVHVVSILGLGGVGKSRFALELAYQVRSTYPNHSIFWIQAAEQRSFQRDLLAIGKELGIPGIEDNNADVKNLVKHRLCGSDENRWLLILDNADDEGLWGKLPNLDSEPQTSSLVDYLPRSSNGLVVITTRTRLVATLLAGKNVIELNELSADQATEMFVSGLENPVYADESTSVQALMDKLGYLPLAIVQATSFINRTQESAATYLELLSQEEDKVIELLSKDFEESSGYHQRIHPVATTWLVSFKQIRDSHPLAAKYLAFMACLNEKNIPLSLLPNDDPNNVTEAVAILAGYSFIRKQSASRSTTEIGSLYDMHRLVHICTRNWLKQEERLSEVTENCLKRVGRIVHDYIERTILRDSIETQIYSLHAHYLCAEECVEETPQRYGLLGCIGFLLCESGKYSEAIELLTIAMDGCLQLVGPTHEETLSLMMHLGRAYSLGSRWSAAKEILERAASAWSATLGPKHQSTLYCQESLAEAYTHLCLWEEAEALSVQLVENWKEVAGDEAPATADSISILALLRFYQGRLDESEVLHKQALEIRRKVNHPFVVKSIRGLASIYMIQAKWAEAEELYEEIKAKTETLYGESSPIVLRTNADLGRIYCFQGKLQEAEILQKRCDEICRRVYGMKHHDTIVNMFNLGATYAAQKRWTDAEEITSQALDNARISLGTESPETAIVMDSLAYIYNCQGRHHEAEALQLHDVQIKEKTWGPQHLETLRARMLLGCTWKLLGRNDEAMPMIRPYWELALAKYGWGHNALRTVSLRMEQLLGVNWKVIVQREGDDIAMPGAWID